MAEYDFECRHCKRMFTILMRVMERMKTTVKCPGCGSAEVEPLMQAFFAKTAPAASARPDPRARRSPHP